jgi:hypothetical protein
MQQDAAETLSASVFMGLVVWGVMSLWPSDSDGWTARLWHAVWYGVDMEQVSIEPKPPDCDFWYAPVGRKACHFKSTIAAFNSAGYLLARDKAPQYNRSALTNIPIVSYDDGKTWWPQNTDYKIKNVLVTWTRTKD